MSEFSRAVIGRIRGWATRAQGTRDYEVVKLAAHLFAVGSQLLATDRSPRMTRRRSKTTLGESLDEVLANLSHLSQETSAPDLYWIVVDALLVLENEICRRYADAEALPRKTELEEILIGDEPVPTLGGEVYHWIHSRSALAKERESREQFARKKRLRRPPDPEPHPGIYLSRLGMYWRSDRLLPLLSWFLPGERFIPLIHQSGRDAAHGGGFRIALCPLRGDFHPIFDVWPAPDLFQAARPGMVGQDLLAQHLDRLLRTAVAQGIHLLVLPELTVDLPARASLTGLLAEVRAALPPYGLIAGSFHFRDGDGDAPCVNETVLLDHSGAVLLTHRKRGRFRIVPSFIERAPSFFSKVHSEPAEQIFEDIQDGSELQILDTTLGRLALLICADAIAADDKGYLPVIQRLRPDLLFVISMSSETEPFERLVKALNEYWIGTIFVNADCICGFAREAPHLAACDFALFEPPGVPPSQIRWIYRRETPDGILYDEKEKKRIWRPLPEPLAETGVSWLKDGDEVLGLVIDLGHQLATERQKGKKTETTPLRSAPKRSRKA